MLAKYNMFLRLIFEEYGQDKNFDKIQYNMVKCFDLFTRKVKAFKALSVEDQYRFVTVSCSMSIASGTHQLINFRTFQKKEYSDFVKEYSIDYGFEEPDPLDITPHRLLKPR